MFDSLARLANGKARRVGLFAIVFFLLAGGLGGPVADPATKQRVVALERAVRERPDVASVTGYYDTRSPAFVSRDRQSTYFAVALKATGDKRLQEAGAAIAEQLG